MNKWNKIYTKKDYPKTDDYGCMGDLLGSIEYKGSRTVWPVYLKGNKWFWIEGNKEIKGDFKVTHWRYYPPSPKD